MTINKKANMQEDKKMEFNDNNFNEVLESLGLIQQKNPNGVDCWDIYKDGIAKWQYDGQEQKKDIYFFLCGMAYAKMRFEIFKKF